MRVSSYTHADPPYTSCLGNVPLARNFSIVMEIKAISMFTNCTNWKALVLDGNQERWVRILNGDKGVEGIASKADAQDAFVLQVHAEYGEYLVRKSTALRSLW